MLANTKIAQKYLELILDKVIYAEDNIYRLMMYKNEKATWFDGKPVLYEFGSGILLL